MHILSFLNTILVTWSHIFNLNFFTAFEEKKSISLLSKSYNTVGVLI